MPLISIGQVENLEDLARDLRRVRESVGEKCSLMRARAERKTAEVEGEVRNSKMLLEQAEAELREARQELEQAEQRQREAEHSLQEAESDLNQCEAGGDYDNEGNFIPPDCSWEASAVRDAQSELAQANDACMRAQEKLRQAEEKHRLMQARVERAQEALRLAKNIQESLNDQIRGRLSTIDELVRSGDSRLAHARGALEGYLAANMDAKALYGCLQQGKKLHTTHSQRNSQVRLSMNAGQLQDFLHYLSHRDVAFRENVASYRRELAEAKGPVEQKLARSKVQKEFSADIAKKAAEHGMNISPDAKKCKTDAETSGIGIDIDLSAPASSDAPSPVKVVMALIEENQEEAENLAILLVKEDAKGEEGEPCQYIQKIRALAIAEPQLELPESRWFLFLDAVRETYPDFVSSYLLNQEDIDEILASALPDDCENILSLAKEAKSKNALLLELPIENKPDKGDE